MAQGRSERSFIADMMLGRLARWMRILGYDVLYENPVEDGALLFLAQKEHRILLTQDTRLVRRRGTGEHLLLHENDPMEQLKEVVRIYPPVSRRMLSRCVVCNAPLVSARKTDVQDEVPEYVYQTESRFGRCQSCLRVFWGGTHARHMAETCRDLMGEVSQDMPSQESNAKGEGLV